MFSETRGKESLSSREARGKRSRDAEGHDARKRSACTMDVQAIACPAKLGSIIVHGVCGVWCVACGVWFSLLFFFFSLLFFLQGHPLQAQDHPRMGSTRTRRVRTWVGTRTRTWTANGVHPGVKTGEKIGKKGSQQKRTSKAKATTQNHTQDLRQELPANNTHTPHAVRGSHVKVLLRLSVPGRFAPPSPQPKL